MIVARMVTCDITKEVQALFGEDIVSRAYLIKDCLWSEQAVTAFKEQFNAEHPCVLDEDLNGETVVLELVNGRKVKMWNSEWGGIEKYEEDNK